MLAVENDSMQMNKWCKLVRVFIEKCIKQTAAKQRLSATFVAIVTWVTIDRNG